MKASIQWVKDKIAEQMPWINKAVINRGTVTPDEFLHLWVHWLLLHDFIKMFGTPENPSGYIIARPAKLAWVFSTDLDYLETLFWHDREGEVAWIDSLWAPGQYPKVLEFLRSTTKRFVAWEHNGKLFCKEIEKLSGDVPKRKEIEEAFLRHI